MHVIEGDFPARGARRGARSAAERGQAAGADRAGQPALPRPELQAHAEEGGDAPPKAADPLHQGDFLRDRAGRPDRDSVGGARPGGFRGGTGRGHRQARPPRERGRRARLRARLHLRQRRERARLPGRATDNGRAPSRSTPSARSARGSRRNWTPRTSACRGRLNGTDDAGRRTPRSCSSASAT